MRNAVRMSMNHSLLRNALDGLRNIEIYVYFFCFRIGWYSLVLAKSARVALLVLLRLSIKLTV